MADKNKGAKHLTDLTLGIEGIKNALDEAQRMIEERSIELGKLAAQNIQKGIGNSNLDSNAFEFKGIEKAQSQIKSVTSELGKLASATNTAIDGKTVKMAEKYKNALGDTTDVIIKLKKGEIELTQQTKTNYEAREKAAEKRKKAEENYSKWWEKALFEKEQKQIAADKKAADSYEKFWLKALKQKEITQAKADKKAAENAERQRKDDIIHLEKMLVKQREFTNLVEKQKRTSGNREIIGQSKELEAAIESELNGLKKIEKAVPGVESNVKNLKIAQDKLGIAFKESGYQGESFLKQITDKAKWLSAFYIVDAIKQGFIQAATVIKETEDAVVQLQRVLSEDVGQSEISEQLYDISKKYARDFNDVQEVAVKFAQTGATWEDTVKLTESAMLALNTAELDVQQSTEGLIAITSQWNIEADEMQEVIDKINITADKFPVTSEKIIAALQRASSSAKNAKLSLEETIGVITALSKATGRSGEAIGTAINSILIYTSKTKALETFYEVGNETVKKTIDAYRSGSTSILAVWKALSENLKELGKEQQEALLSGIDTEGLATHLNEEAAGILEDIQKVYGTAGTHRQNWLVGLLNDIGTVEDVTNNMTNAVGYSTAENEKYMKTLSAYYEQFKAVWKELAVQLGEGTLGLTSFFKAALATGSALGTIIKHTGGLANTLTIVAGVLLQIKAQKIQEKFLTPAISSVKELRIKLLQFVDTVHTARAAGSSWSQSLKAAGANVNSLAFSLGALQIALGAVTAAYSLITSAVTKANEKIQESNQKAIERFENTSLEADSTKQLYEEFLRLKDIENMTQSEQQEFSQTTLELANRLKIATKTADGASKTFSQLAKDVEDAGKKIGQLTEGEWKYYEEALEYEFKLAGKTKGLFGILVNDLKVYANELAEVSPEIRKNIESIMGDYFNIDAGVVFFAPGKDEEEGFYKATVAAKQYFDEVQKNRPLTEEEQKIYGRLIDVINELKDSFITLQKTRTEHFIATHQELVENANTVEGYNALIKAVSEYLGVGENMVDMVKGLVQELLPNLGFELEETATVASFSAEEIEALKDSISSLNSEVDAMQSGINTAYSALDEYRNQGYLSIDMIQSLTNAGLEYANLLEFTDDGIRLNEEATANLINAQRENVLEMIKQSTAAQILELAHEELGIQIKGTKEEGDNLSKGLTGVGAELQNVALQALNTAMSMEEFKVSLQEALGAEGDYDAAALERFKSGSQAIIEGGKKMMEQVRNIGTIEQYVPSAAKKGEEAVKSRYDAEKKAIESTKQAINDRYSAEKERLEAQKNAIKEKYEAEINGLKEVQKENSRLDKQEEYIRNKRKAEEDVEKAATRSGVEYREQEQEAREKLADIETDWNKVLRDWSIEDRIKSLENLRDAEIASIDAQIKAREKLKEQELKDIEGRMKTLEAEKNARIGAGHQVAHEAKNASQEVNKSAKETTVKTTHELADMWYQVIESGSKEMKEKAEANAKMLYASYSKEFIIPFSNNLEGIAFQMRYMKPDLPLPGFDFYSKAMSDLNSLKQNPSPVYNTTQTRNSFMVANITGESAAKGITKDFWTMP